MTNLTQTKYIQSLKSILKNGNEIPKSDMETIVNYGKNFIISLQGALYSWNEPSHLYLLKELKSEVHAYNKAKHGFNKNMTIIEGKGFMNRTYLSRNVINARMEIYLTELVEFNIERINQIERILGSFQFNRLYQPKF